MNIINILVNLLSKAYAAEARKHKRLASKHAAQSVTLADAAVDLAYQSDIALAASKQAAADSEAADARADNVAAKAQEVANFFKV